MKLGFLQKLESIKNYFRQPTLKEKKQFHESFYKKP